MLQFISYHTVYCVFARMFMLCILARAGFGGKCKWTHPCLAVMGPHSTFVHAHTPHTHCSSHTHASSTAPLPSSMQELYWSAHPLPQPLQSTTSSTRTCACGCLMSKYVHHIIATSILSRDLIFTYFPIFYPHRFDWFYSMFGAHSCQHSLH